MKNITTEKIKNRLQAKKLSPSIQRVKILEYLLREDSHPSVHEIHCKLSKEIPTLSKTTVYNTLNKFVEIGLAKELRIDGIEVRYDGHIAPHAHFKCVQCDKVYNIKYQCPMFVNKSVDGHEIRQREVNFLGVCKNCLEKEKTQKKEDVELFVK